MNTAQFIFRHPAHFIAYGFGSGLSPIAPGTAGTLWAWLSYHYWLQSLSLNAWLILLCAGFLVGWWACTVTARNQNIADPSGIVWDEILAFWLILWLCSPQSLGQQFFAFLLFRFFDAYKMGPVAWADQTFKGFGPKGGFGIIFDDLVAAFCTLLVISLSRYMGMSWV